MKLFKSKKGFVYFAAMLLVTIMVLTKAFIVLSEKQERIPPDPIGSQQFSLIRIYQDTNNHLTNLNLAVYDSANLAYYKLAKTGGKNFKRETLTSSRVDCGTYGGYELWSNSQLSDVDCYPDYQLDFKTLLDENLNKILGLYSIPNFNFEVGLIPVGDYLKIIGSSSYQAQISKPTSQPSTIKKQITPITSTIVPTTSVSSVKLEKDPTNGGITYSDVTAINGHFHESVKAKGDYKFLTEAQFRNLYYITDLDSAHLEMNDEIKKGNALTFEMGNALLDIAQSWYDSQCQGSISDCKATVYVSSISTGPHSPNSQHNRGNAVDIAACRDAQGNLHTAIEKSSTFLDCYEIIKSIIQPQGTYIYLNDCLIYEPQSKTNLECTKDYSSSHQNHIHIHITTN